MPAHLPRKLLLAVLVAVGLPQTPLNAQAALENANFKIGLIYSKTGPLAPHARSLANAVKLGLDEFRQDQPALGREVAVVVADDKSLASEATKAAERLFAQQKISVLIGSMSNTANQAILASNTDKTIPVLLPNASSEELLERPNVFGLSVSDRWQGRLIAYYAKNSLMRSKVLLVEDTNNPRSEPFIAGFKEAFAKIGGTVVAQVDLAKDSALPEAGANKPDLIVFTGGSLTQNALTEAIDRSGLDLLVSNNFRLPAPARAKGALFILQNFSELDPHPEVQDFVKTYKSRYNETPDMLAAAAYEGVRVILHSFMLSRSVAGRSIMDILSNDPLGGIYGVGQFNKDRIFMRPIPFLVSSKGKLAFKNRIKPE